MSAAAVQAVPPVSYQKIASKPWLTCACLAMADAVGVCIAIGLISMVFGNSGGRHFRLSEFFTLLVFVGMGLYPGYGVSPLKEFKLILTGTSVSSGLIGSFLFLENSGWVALDAVWFGWGAATLSIIVCRNAARQLYRGKKWWGAPVVVFGSGATARRVVRHLQKHSAAGLRLVAVLDDNLHDFPEIHGSDVRLGRRSDATVLALDCGVSHAIVALPHASGSEIRSLVRGEAKLFRHLVVIPDLGGISSEWVEPRDFGGVLGLQIGQKHLHVGSQLLKRMFDLIIGSVVALIALPIILLVILLVRLTSAGPILYGQSRIGLDNVKFTAWKFRSMYQNADELLFRYLQADPNLRREWERDHKLRRDPRITRVGAFLRKTSLDELPQLWNVLKGDMSLVGPRPIVTAEIQRYGISFDAYKSVRPGITGMWQVSGRNNTSYEERIQFDEYYVANWSIWLDLYILGRTVKTVLLTEGAY